MLACSVWRMGIIIPQSRDVEMPRFCLNLPPPTYLFLGGTLPTQLPSAHSFTDYLLSSWEQWKMQKRAVAVPFFLKA